MLTWKAVADQASAIIEKMQTEKRIVPTAADLAPLDALFGEVDKALSDAIARAKAEGR